MSFVKEEIVSFVTAKLAEEKGFEVETIADVNAVLYDEEGKVQEEPYYNEYMTLKEFVEQEKASYWLAPTQALLRRWLREVHNIQIRLNWVYKKSYDTDVFWHYDVKGIGLIMNNLIPHQEDRFMTYEKALEKGLQEALKLIKMK